MIREGDKVKLKDSQTPMKVVKLDDDYIVCEWINQLGAEMKGSFPIHLLEIISS